MDPRYMDFGEVDSSAFHPITQNEVWNKARPDLFKMVNVLGLGGSLVGGRV